MIASNESASATIRAASDLDYLAIDRDTLMVASTAAFFGPVFVAQVAAAIRNPSLLAPGIAVGLLGFAIGNYLGLGVAYLMQWAL